MNNALFLFLSCGLISVVSAFIYSGLKRHRRRESADTPPRSRAVRKSRPEAIRQPRLPAAAKPANASRVAVAEPTPTQLRDLLPKDSLGFAVVDLETTQVGVKQARVVEIAITLVDPQARIERRWHSLVNAELTIPNSHIHGISDAMVTPAPSFSALAPTIGALLNGRVLVAHNLRSFDLPILENCFARCGAGDFDPGDGIDTMPSPRLSLKKLCEAHGISLSSSDGQLYPGQGMVFEAVEHSGRSVHAPEEIDRIEELVDALVGSRYAIAHGNRTEEGVLDANTILVTAPYNVQVNRLQQRLKGRARVGTVDKFQGQEAPVAIHSLTASSGDEAPRGVGFLLEPNRLNVAISRAQCLSIVVGSPGLASGIANTVAEAVQINRLCRLSNEKGGRHQ